MRAPARLHFGLLSIGDAQSRQFGGVGVMIDRPATDVRVRLAESVAEVPRDPATGRAYEFADRFRRSLNDRDEFARVADLAIEVIEAPGEHIGLGSGTQMALSVARAMAVFAGHVNMSSDELARRVGRGNRSAIGVHGFQLGGFIVEGGKTDSSKISPLVARLNFPDEWQFVLVIEDGAKGRHGIEEREAFDQLAPIPVSLTAELCRLTMLGMLPAIADRDYSAFCESLTEFGQKVGECFAPYQRGPYSSGLAPTTLEVLARHGVRGIAQSSWGPTIAAVVDSRFRAEWLAARLADSLPEGTQIVTAPPNNLGAKIEVHRGGNAVRAPHNREPHETV